MLKTLEQACIPRPSVFDPNIRDTVYNIDDLPNINAARFFDENYVTQGMRQLLTEVFKRLSRYQYIGAASTARQIAS